jgi:hypothetical protein
MGSSSKRQMTMAKKTREQAVRERRERKQEKKQAAAAARLARANGTLPAEELEDETPIAEQNDSGDSP